MRLLCDTSVSGRLTRELRTAGHDVIQVDDVWPIDPGDEIILAFAFSESRIVITRDKDFGELVVLFGRAHAGILRMTDTPGRQQFSVCKSALQRFPTELLIGAIVTVSPFRIRIRGGTMTHDD